MRLTSSDGMKLMLVGDLAQAAGLGDWAEGENAADVMMVDLGVSLRDVVAKLRGSRDETRSLTAAVARLVGQSISDVERELILQTLRHCGGNRSAASATLGISVRTMRNKLRAYQDEGVAIPPAPMGVAAAPAPSGIAAGA